MKLYTEEQVIKAIDLSRLQGAEPYLVKYREEEILNMITPIELPNKMTDNKEQTVVQQIVQALDIECKSRGMNVNWDMYLEMEKKQIEKAWDEGDVNIKLFYCGEQYYNETYGK